MVLEMTFLVSQILFINYLGVSAQLDWQILFRNKNESHLSGPPGFIIFRTPNTSKLTVHEDKRKIIYLTTTKKYSTAL
jgi:hypothetical protein